MRLKLWKYLATELGIVYDFFQKDSMYENVLHRDYYAFMPLTAMFKLKRNYILSSIYLLG